jgi:hypothetical protein
MENLLIVNRFIPKSAPRLTAGLSSTALAIAFYVFLFLKSEREPF